MFGALLQGGSRAGPNNESPSLSQENFIPCCFFFSLNPPSFAMFAWKPSNSFAVAKSLLCLSFPFFEFIFQSSHD
ncbi:hypothetical protein IEQ34_011953 [Dendrobium chrysotoxum]|uniref:Uncharacterized protein n=1 Tax=Dendrobium chrysotoxum TaxID=161865 RepID=A0AAV7GUB0_DENCH|nr:hypothetical protein IEQ34_011953 [Dendrobium chrysotoxum]